MSLRELRLFINEGFIITSKKMIILELKCLPFLFLLRLKFIMIFFIQRRNRTSKERIEKKIQNKIEK